MVWDCVRAGQLTPFDWESTSNGGSSGSQAGGVVDNGFYEGRLPIHSNDASLGTQVFTMDAQTGAYTFGYDTGNHNYMRFVKSSILTSVYVSLELAYNDWTENTWYEPIKTYQKFRRHSRGYILIWVFILIYSGGGQHQSYRVETRSPDGTVTGRYGYVDPRGVLRIVDYVADRRGYRYDVIAN